MLKTMQLNIFAFNEHGAFSRKTALKKQHLFLNRNLL